MVKKTDRTVTLDDNIFGIVPNDHAIYLDVKQIMANRRQGTHSTKQRSEVAGSTRKLKRQKGTGGARAGSIKIRFQKRLVGLLGHNQGYIVLNLIKVETTCAKISAEL